MYDSAPIIKPFPISSGVALHIAVFIAIASCVALAESIVFLLCVVCFLYLFSVHVELCVVYFLHLFSVPVIVLFRCLVLLVSVPVELDVFLPLIVLFQSFVPMPVFFRLLK